MGLLSIEQKQPFGGKKTFNILKIKKDNDNNHHSSTTTKPTKSKPSIYITTVENTSVKYYN